MAKTTNESETKLCKYCQSEIPKAAKVCPNCRKKQGGKGKWVVLIIVIIIIIVIIASAAGSGSGNSGSTTASDAQTNSEDNSTGSETASSTENDMSDETNEANNSSDDSEKLSAGSSFVAGGLTITINETNANFTDYDDEYGWNAPADGMKYVMASFTFENTGSSDEYVSIYDFDCYADNATCDEQYGLDDSDFINTNLSSGRSVTFSVYFAVPTDAQSIELEYETNYWTDNKAIIIIQ